MRIHLHISFLPALKLVAAHTDDGLAAASLRIGEAQRPPLGWAAAGKVGLVGEVGLGPGVGLAHAWT